MALTTTHRAARRVAIVCFAENAGDCIALTFDDGPLIPYTEQILESLAHHNAQATFFVRGRALTSSGNELVTRAHAAGHEIGNHTQNHLDLSQADMKTIAAEISKTHNQLAELLGSPPLVIRPPYGRGCDAVDRFASALGYRATVLWNVCPQDWTMVPADRVVASVLAGENPEAGEIRTHCPYVSHSPLPGAIVLLHDGALEEGESRSETVRAVQVIVPQLQSRGLQLVTVSDMLAVSNA
jgi:peptidoglycan/xylan/chitin deacetylase (PgdA/CDA1 family)